MNWIIILIVLYVLSVLLSLRIIEATYYYTKGFEKVTFFDIANCLLPFANLVYAILGVVIWHEYFGDGWYEYFKYFRGRKNDMD